MVRSRHLRLEGNCLCLVTMCHQSCIATSTLSFAAMDVHCSALCNGAICSIGGECVEGQACCRFAARAMQGTKRRWHDGSLENDLPFRQLSELFNVNNFIVSQTNPHLVPIMSLKQVVGHNLFELMETEIKHSFIQVGCRHMWSLPWGQVDPLVCGDVRGCVLPCFAATAASAARYERFTTCLRMGVLVRLTGTVSNVNMR